MHQPFITEASVADWNDNKKADFVNHVSGTVSAAQNPSESDNILHRELYELLQMGMLGKITHEKVAECLSALGEKVPKEMIEESLCDVLWLVGEEAVELKDSKPELKGSLASLANQILSHKVANADLLKERVSEEVLQEMALIKSAADAKARLQRLRTGKVYSQQKFNLMREESEGYAKLIVDLEQGLALTEDNVERVANNIQSLIAYFNLDPNRVLDVVLDCFESCLNQPCYFILIKKFSATSLIQVLGFKFHGHMKAGTRPPSSLFKLVATLCKNKVIHVSDIYPYLSAEDEEIKKSFEEHCDKVVDQVRKMRVFTLSKMDEVQKGEETPYDPAPHAVGGDDNQKLVLTAAFLDVGDWTSASYMFDVLGAVLPTSYPPVAKSLCNLIHRMIDPLYRSIIESSKLLGLLYKSPKMELTSNSEGMPVISDMSELEKIMPFMRHLSIYLHEDVVLLVKLCRIVKECIKSSDGKPPEFVKEILLNFMGVLALLPANAAIASDLWECIKLFPYLDRYWIYSEAHWQLYFQHPQLLVARANAREEMRKLLKGLTKENVSKQRRHLAKICHSNPLVVMEVVLDQIQEYESMIDVCKDALGYCGSLALDILSYLIVEELGGALYIAKPFLQDDCANLARWLLNFSSFLSDVYLKYPRMEMKGLLQHIFNRLQKDSFGELQILRDLVAKLAGIKFDVATISTEDIDSRSGGERLRLASEYPWPTEVLFDRAEAAGDLGIGKLGGAAKIKAYQAAQKERSEACKWLVNSLQESKLTVPLLILIAQQTSGCLFTAEAIKQDKIRFSSWLHVQCQETLLVYADFLWRRVPNKDIAGLIPGPMDLITQLQMEPALALFVLRPAFKGTDNSAVLDLSLHAKDILNSMPSNLKQSSPALFTTFWSLTLNDISVPVETYENHERRLKKALADLEETDRLDPKAKEKDVKKWKESITLDLDKLEKERKKQVENNKKVMTKISDDKDSLVEKDKSYKAIPCFFLQTCVFPRCVQSPEDAVFCARFVHLLHKIKTPNLSTILIYNMIITTFGPMVFSRTEQEAKHFGKFLSETLHMLNRWASTEEIFKKECENFPGFTNVSQKSTKPEKIAFSSFQQCSRNWHKQLSKAFTTCLESSEGTEVHNALTILSELVGGTFPVYDAYHAEVKQRVQKLIGEEQQFGQSIVVMARSVNARLQACEAKMLKLPSKGKRKEAPEKDKDVDREKKLKNEKGAAAPVKDVKPEPVRRVEKEEEDKKDVKREGNAESLHPVRKRNRAEDDKGHAVKEEDPRAVRHKQDGAGGQPSKKEGSLSSQSKSPADGRDGKEEERPGHLEERKETKKEDGRVDTHKGRKDPDGRDGRDLGRPDGPPRGAPGMVSMRDEVPIQQRLGGRPQGSPPRELKGRGGEGDDKRDLKRLRREDDKDRHPPPLHPMDMRLDPRDSGRMMGNERPGGMRGGLPMDRMEPPGSRGGNFGGDMRERRERPRPGGSSGPGGSNMSGGGMRGR
eukprot:762475-Hanusia_phi.AAC.4